LKQKKPKWQIKDDEWAKRYELAFSKTEKTTSEIDTSKTDLKEKEEVKQKIEEKVKDLITVLTFQTCRLECIAGNIKKREIRPNWSRSGNWKRVAEKSNKEYSKSTIRPENTVCDIGKNK